jgi:hypothetical protein
MARYAIGGRPTCESCKSIDVREFHRDNLLGSGRRFNLSWSRDGESTGSIGIETEQDAIVLIYKTRRYGATEWQDVRQRVPITWTHCNLGGRRPWFICAVSCNGRRCGRRVAKLYDPGDLFACRHCCGLAYASQHGSLHHRSISKAQKIRMRLGGDPSLLAPFPEKPKGVHWKKYWRLRSQALEAEGTATMLLSGWLLSRRAGIK